METAKAMDRTRIRKGTRLVQTGILIGRSLFALPNPERVIIKTVTWVSGDGQMLRIARDPRDKGAYTSLDEIKRAYRIAADDEVER